MDHDGRHFGREAQAERRRLAVKLVDEQGLSADAAADVLGVHRDTIWRWKRQHAARGDSLFEASERRGPARARMTPEQLAWLVDAVQRRTPQDFGGGSPLWTLELMQAAVQSQFGERIPLSTLHRHVSRAGLRPRQPQKRATERSDSEVDRQMGA